MALRRTKKRRKMSRMHGTGTHGGGARKKRKKSGHRGGAGMSGTGKRSDHKKTLVTTLYGHNYFGKQGITSRGTKRDKRRRINLREIESDLEGFVKRGIAKKTNDGYEITLPKHKILGDLDHNLKHKFVIKAKEASKSALEKVRKAGGDIILTKNKEE